MQLRAKKIKFSSRTDIFRDMKIKSMSILKYFKQKNNKSSRATKPAKDVSIRWLKAYYLYQTKLFKQIQNVDLLQLILKIKSLKKYPISFRGPTLQLNKI